ncbi:hypothetical protein [Congregicoccus parvus]|uniref:hypothetical protein n=1 Tax=Congregicoccus parvus TaxID=3081749 RepID=UPI003FA576F0
MNEATPLPAPIVQSRRDACTHCPAPCEPFAAGAIDHEDPCAACPAGLWIPMRCADKARRLRGLGDLVHLAARPVVAAVKAATLDHVDLDQCGGCAARRARWNAAVPFGGGSAKTPRRPRDTAAERPRRADGVTG